MKVKLVSVFDDTYTHRMNFSCNWKSNKLYKGLPIYDWRFKSYYGWPLAEDGFGKTADEAQAEWERLNEYFRETAKYEKETKET